jgi:hypothetical protein
MSSATSSATSSAASTLPDGLVAFVKRDCPTCVLVVPVIERLAHAAAITVFSQDDPAFPSAAPWVRDDTDLTVSWHHDIETVPTLVRVQQGAEVERIVGWDREQWERFTAIGPLGEDLPPFRPGCGSLSVDPTRTDELTVRFSGSALRARRVELAALEDEADALFDRGWTDGLPVVAPTEARVLRMLAGTSRRADDVVATVAPNLVECTVEKVAINAVMAGCRPEYLPVVLAAVAALCTDRFNIHGVLATTMPVGPVLVVNGPIRHEIGMNRGINVLGPGNRANSTIGRAVQLVVRNVGGGVPGGVDRATHGNPGKIGVCFPEDEECSPWETVAMDAGFAAGEDTVTVFCGEGPRVIVDQLSRTPESLTRMLADCLKSSVSTRTVMAMDGLLVLCPEHLARYHDAGWSKARFREELAALLQIETDDIVRGAGGIDEGLPANLAGMTLPKFHPDGGLLVARAGGGAGLFSMVFGGWLRGDKGSLPVTVPIAPWR